MTTDITELAQSLKAAAERVIKNYDSEWFETGSQICTVHKSKINLISLANPVNVLALVEAQEKAQQRITQMESRTVTVNLPDYRNTYKAPLADEVEHQVRLALELFSSAAGIKVEAE
ncbi:hypothetical protein NL448_08830 [Klebsiella pneumoniae]|nr:hypothetical protein [Klebsiella pneumoniae]MCP6222601.1 hypothetical protein [Klebsiella pneumoniae]